MSAGHAPFGGSRRFCRPALFTSRGLLHSLLLGFFLRGTFGSWALTPLLPSSHLWAPQTIRDHSPSPDLLTSSHLQSPFCHMRYRPHRLGCRHLQRAIILSTLGPFLLVPFCFYCHYFDLKGKNNKFTPNYLPLSCGLCDRQAGSPLALWMFLYQMVMEPTIQVETTFFHPLNRKAYINRSANITYLLRVLAVCQTPLRSSHS